MSGGVRVAVIAPQFPEYSLEYARSLSNYAEVLACVDARQFLDEYTGRDPPIEHIQHFRPTRFATPLDLLTLLFRVVRYRPAVVHFQESAGPRKSFFSACVATLMKPFALIVLTVHDPVAHTGRDQAAARRTAWLHAYIRRSSDLIVVHNAYCATQFRQHRRLAAKVPRQRIVVSEHGVILEPPIVFATAHAGIKLYFFGRMEQYKGVEVALRMAEILHTQNLDFQLRIAGRGPELDRLQSRFEALPEVEVFNGFVPPRQIIDSIQEADCVILPYLNATQSGVLAAAFAGRRCVIASEVGGLADIVEHMRNGILVPPADPQALADAVLMLAADADLRARLRQGAERTAITRLNWDRISQDLFDAFRQAESERKVQQPA